MHSVDSAQDAAAIAKSDLDKSRDSSIYARLLDNIGLAFDTIAVEFLDHLPSTITVAAIVILLAMAQVLALVVLWALGLAQFHWATVISVAVMSLMVGVPVVGFGQMQYRRARRAYFGAEQLTRKLIVARDEALRATEEKSRFLASMSHELRTPLNAIIGFSEIIKDQALGPLNLARHVEYASHIHNSGRHLLSLINDVLDLSKIESGKSHIDTNGDVDLTQAITDCCQTVAIIAAKKNIKLSAEMSSGALCVQANGRMIRQVLLNLTSNAVKFSSENAEVVVRMRLDPTHGAVIEVSDTGIGMTAAETRIALQPFGQIDSRRSRECEGTGLGLPLARAMVELHGGRLEIKSVPGEGTTVSFNIPAARVIAATAQALRAA